jgi:hypothetical protein
VSILGRLASALGRRDEVPNVELAAELAASGDKAAIAELAAALSRAKRPLQHDAIKALDEIGAARPELIAPHADAILLVLKSRDNRMLWGALTALDALVATNPRLIAAHLPTMLDAADRSSVIARDKVVSILATLAALPGVAPKAWEFLLAILRTSAVNQTPMYAEQALRAAAATDPKSLAEVVRRRIAEIPQPAKKARLEKVLRKLEKW